MTQRKSGPVVVVVSESLISGSGAIFVGVSVTDPSKSRGREGKGRGLEAAKRTRCKMARAESRWSDE